jgi:hypothetical protein
VSADATSEASFGSGTATAAPVRRGRHVLPALIIVAAGVASFIPALNAPFLGEDLAYVQQNKDIRRLTSIPSFFRADYWNRTKTNGGRAYRPIGEVTLALDYALFRGLRPWGFRLTNLVLHLLVALAVYAVAYQVLRHTGAALAAGALFVTHPVQAETVQVIKNRGDLLATLFALLSWMAFMTLVERAHARAERGHVPGPAAPGRQGAATGPSGLRGLIVGVFFFIVALCSKETAITLPILLLVYTAALVPIGWRGWAGAQTLVWWVALWGYLALSLAAIEKFSGAMSPGRLPGGDDALVAVKTVGVYLWLLLAPVATGVTHPFHPPAGVGAWPVIVSLASLAAILVACVAIFRRHRLAAFALAWLPITLLPLSNIVPLEGAAIVEHRLYFPAVGFCLLLGSILAVLAQARLGKTPAFAGAYRIACIVLTVVVALYVVRSATRSLVWGRIAPGGPAVEGRASPDERLDGPRRDGQARHGPTFPVTVRLRRT